MTPRKKVHLEKVKASLTTTCPSCRYEIPPAEVRRVSTTKIICPKCKETFGPR